MSDMLGSYVFNWPVQWMPGSFWDLSPVYRTSGRPCFRGLKLANQIHWNRKNSCMRCSCLRKHAYTSIANFVCHKFPFKTVCIRRKTVHMHNFQFTYTCAARTRTASECISFKMLTPLTVGLILHPGNGNKLCDCYLHFTLVKHINNNTREAQL